MTVGERIKQKRIEMNLSQDELAKKVGYKSRSSIQKIESARNLPITKVAKMALALECSPGYLMGWEDEQIENSPHFVSDKDNAFQERLESYNQNQVLKALDFIDSFSHLDPDTQAAIEILLKSRKSDS